MLQPRLSRLPLLFAVPALVIGIASAASSVLLWTVASNHFLAMANVITVLTPAGASIAYYVIGFLVAVAILTVGSSSYILKAYLGRSPMSKRAKALKFGRTLALCGIAAVCLSAWVMVPAASATISSTPSAIVSAYSCEKGPSFLITVDNAVPPDYYAIAASGTATTPCGTLSYGGPGNAGGATGTSAQTVLQNAITALGTGGGNIFVGNDFIMSSGSITISQPNISIIGQTGLPLGSVSPTILIFNVTISSASATLSGISIENIKMRVLEFNAVTNAINIVTIQNCAIFQNTSPGGIELLGTAAIHNVLFNNINGGSSVSAANNKGFITVNDTNSGDGQLYFNELIFGPTSTTSSTMLQVNGNIQPSIVFNELSYDNAGASGTNIVFNIATAPAQLQSLIVSNSWFEIHNAVNLVRIASGAISFSANIFGNSIQPIAALTVINNLNSALSNWHTAKQNNTYTFHDNNFAPVTGYVAPVVGTIGAIGASGGVGDKSFSFTMKNNLGLNPINKITNPFATTYIGPGGSAAVPSASTIYNVAPTDEFITAADSSNSNNAILVKDAAGNTVIGPSSTLSAQFIPEGYEITWGAFTGTAGAVTVWGV